jgi:prepilin-type N-terminal cleavage/methylation domain-containing protein
MKRRAGFTLIELVVVIMILGILAGVAAPKFFGTSTTANENGMKQTLSIVRDAIELYNAKYNALPSCTAPGTDFKLLLKPFLRGPIPPVTVGATAIRNSDISTVADANAITADASPDKGYKYNSQTGEFVINSTTYLTY